MSIVKQTVNNAFKLFNIDWQYKTIAMQHEYVQFVHFRIALRNILKQVVL